MSAIDIVIANANGTVKTPEPAALLLAQEDAKQAKADALAPVSKITYTVDGFEIVRHYNERAVKASEDRYNVHGKADAWDTLIAGMLDQKRGAETLVKPKIGYGNDGVPKASYPTAKIQKAILRLPAHLMTRVTVERLKGSHDESTGSVTFGSLLITAKPAGR